MGEKGRRPSAAGAAEEELPEGAMASMESRMEARKSGLARRGSGGEGTGTLRASTGTGR